MPNDTMIPAPPRLVADMPATPTYVAPPAEDWDVWRHVAELIGVACVCSFVIALVVVL